VIPEPGVFYCFFFFLFNFYFYYSCIINFTIIILLALFFPSSLSFPLLCYNPLFSLPTTLSGPSHPLFSHLHLLFLSSPNLSPHYLSLLHTHHLLTSLLYQLHTIPAPCNPWHKHPSLQQQKYIQTHTRETKSSSLHTSSSTHLPPFPPPLLVPPLPIPQNL
jgi:hypothetical protein